MQYLLTPYNENRPPFAYWENAFTQDQIDWIKQKAVEKSNPAQVGGGGDGMVQPGIRRSMVGWMDYNPESAWLYNTLAHIVSSLNSQFFRLDLTGFGEPFQLTNYDESYEGMYGWHVDFGGNVNSISRKLSLVLQLSDPADYEGGVLELKPSGSEVIKVKKQQGLIVVFPSYTLHQVTPTTKGFRQSLVSWISGPPFR